VKDRFGLNSIRDKVRVLKRIRIYRGKGIQG
jgi:hypothetical protein